MSYIDRAKRRFAIKAGYHDNATDESVRNRQYTIPPPEDEGIRLFYGVRSFFAMRFIDLVFWKFKTSFLNVILVFLLIYLIFVNIFTLIIYGVVKQSERNGVECIGGWDYVGTEGGRSLNWELSFSLSWTSFSTVGFGTVSPDTLAGCYGIRYTCAIEAFLGVLYAGFCGAIFFAKFSRLMGRAQVKFSSTLCIQYGSAVRGRHEEGLLGTLRGQKDEGLIAKRQSLDERKVPFPVLEFRIVNMRANEKGCEILDATISCLSCINEGSHPGSTPRRNGTVDESVSSTHHDMDANTLADEPPKVNVAKNMFQKMSTRDIFKRDERYPSPSSRGDSSAERYPIPSSRRDSPSEQTFLFDDGVNEKINLMRQKYQNLDVQTRHHPYFRRVWYIRHQLDASSPLVDPGVKRRIRECGHWPWDLNDHNSVRESLIQFHTIVVTLNGTSNLNASDVFAQYKYKYRDIHVGWQFAGMMYFSSARGKEKEMKVDTSLIHDILPQAGGGHEPIEVFLD